VSTHPSSKSFCLELGRQNLATKAVTPYVPSRGFFSHGSGFIDGNVHRFQIHLIFVVGQNIVLLLTTLNDDYRYIAEVMIRVQWY
jgi:hypothetical protein